MPQETTFDNVFHSDHDILVAMSVKLDHVISSLANKAEAAVVAQIQAEVEKLEARIEKLESKVEKVVGNWKMLAGGLVVLNVILVLASHFIR